MKNLTVTIPINQHKQSTYINTVSTFRTKIEHLKKKFTLPLGYNLVRFSRPYEKNNLSYSRVLPFAIYSPWLDDTNFQKTYQKIKDEYTLVDMYRCFELWQLIEQTNKINANADVLEVGVWRGGTSIIMAKQLQLLKSKATVYSADTFEGVVKTSEKDANYKGGEHSDTSLTLFNAVVKTHHLTNVRPLKGIFPEETAALIPTDSKFKLCHIDVDVYLSAKGVQEWIWDRLIVGGLIIFDDFGFSSTNGITNFVNEQRMLKDRTVIHNLNGHAVVIKLR